MKIHFYLGLRIWILAVSEHLETDLRLIQIQLFFKDKFIFGSNFKILFIKDTSKLFQVCFQNLTWLINFRNLTLLTHVSTYISGEKKTLHERIKGN